MFNKHVSSIMYEQMLTDQTRLTDKKKSYFGVFFLYPRFHMKRKGIRRSRGLDGRLVVHVLRTGRPHTRAWQRRRSSRTSFCVRSANCRCETDIFRTSNVFTARRAQDRGAETRSGNTGNGSQDEDPRGAASGLSASHCRAQGVPLRQGGTLQHASGRCTW